MKEKQDIKDFRDRAKELVAEMTLEEKAGLCSGQDCWNTKPIERFKLGAVMMSDGPHGLRKQIGEADNLGIGESVPAVCFPTASALACSFNRELLYEIGRAMGEECLQEQVSVILGPGVNQKRSPLCGRNFEYFSEDPLLSGELAASMIKGIQSTGVSASLKHFAVNNQEKRRMTINAVIDERTLRETYLKAFEIAVKKGKPDTVMCAYNRLNGEYCSENEYLLTDILRKEWGFENTVISDWGAVHDRALGIKAGLDIEMPGNRGFNDAKVLAAVKNGSLSLTKLDEAAENACALILKGLANKKKGYLYNKKEHHSLAVTALEESAVLLKNEGKLLPGHIGQKAAVIGAFAKTLRYQGAGSSKIHPLKIENPWEMFIEFGADVTYAKGFSLEAKPVNGEAESLREEACQAAGGKDIVYVFAGLPEGYESEGFDRGNMSLPPSQNRLIDAICEENENVVVILIGGAPVELPWIHKVKAVLLAYLGGEGAGRAIVNLLLGYRVPSGKLAETWPIALEDIPCYHYFPGKRLTSEYRESIYIGYRYYEKAGKPVLFPFGYGLSYTEFSYSGLELSEEVCRFGSTFTLSFELLNCGGRKAKEISFIFMAHKSEVVFLPEKELREFIKVELEPGETKRISMTLDTSTLGYYNTAIKDWYCESGEYEVIIGSSSRDCRLVGSIRIDSPAKPQPDFTKSAPSYYRLENKEFTIDEKEFAALYGRTPPKSGGRASRPYSPENTLEDVAHTFIGKIIMMYANWTARKVSKAEKEQEGMMAATIREMPFFAMAASGEEMLPEHVMEGIIEFLNGRYIAGLRKLLKF